MCQWYILEASVLATWPLIIWRDKPVLWKWAKNNLSSSEASYWKASLFFFFKWEPWWSFCHVKALVSWGLDTARSVNNLTVFFLSDAIEEQIYDGLTCNVTVTVKQRTKSSKVVQRISKEMRTWKWNHRGIKLYICTYKHYHKKFAFLLCSFFFQSPS